MESPGQSRFYLFCLPPWPSPTWLSGPSSKDPSTLSNGLALHAIRNSWPLRQSLACCSPGRTVRSFKALQNSSTAVDRTSLLEPKEVDCSSFPYLQFLFSRKIPMSEERDCVVKLVDDHGVEHRMLFSECLQPDVPIPRMVRIYSQEGFSAPDWIRVGFNFCGKPLCGHGAELHTANWSASLDKSSHGKSVCISDSKIPFLPQ